MTMLAELTLPPAQAWREKLMTSEGFDQAGMCTYADDIDALNYLCERVKVRSQRARPRVLEIGSFAGRTALTMEAHGFDVHCVDIWFVCSGGVFPPHKGHFTDDVDRDEPLLNIFARNVGDKLFRTIHPHVGHSLQWAALWPDDMKMDMIYIDGDHSLVGVLHDIAAWLPHVEPGGILAGHDYNWPDVKFAARHIGADGWTEPEVEPNWGGLWWKFL